MLCKKTCNLCPQQPPTCAEETNKCKKKQCKKCSKIKNCNIDEKSANKCKKQCKQDGKKKKPLCEKTCCDAGF